MSSRTDITDRSSGSMVGPLPSITDLTRNIPGMGLGTVPGDLTVTQSLPWPAIDGHGHGQDRDEAQRRPVS